MDNKSNKMMAYKIEAVDRIEYEDGEYSDEKMLIGFFDSIEVCKEVEDAYKHLPGFSLPSCSFIITEYHFLPKDSNPIERVFIVQDWLFDDSTGDETVIEIGVFLSPKEAEKKKEEYIVSKGGQGNRRSNKSGTIIIDEYTINELHWTEGFIRDYDI